MLNISFTFTGFLNGRPYWTSTQYGMQMIWTGPYWQIINWPYDGTPVNYTDTDIPLTGWQLIDSTTMTANFTVNLGECCFNYSFVNNVGRSFLDISYVDCNGNSQEIVAGFGFSGSFCAKSISYVSNPGSLNLTGNSCPSNTNCYNWELIGPVTVYYTDCNGVSGNMATVPNGEFGPSICALSIDIWDNAGNFYIQGYCDDPSVSTTLLSSFVSCFYRHEPSCPC